VKTSANKSLSPTARTFADFRKGCWEGLCGYVQSNLAKEYLAQPEDPSEIEFYLCGPPDMMDSIVETLDSFDVDEDMIFYDKFWFFSYSQE